MNSGLETFFPAPRVVHGVTIQPVRMRQLPAFARAIQPIWGLLMAEAWWQIATDHYDEAVTAVLAATDGASAADIGELYPDQFFDLCKAVFEVNLDFFGRRLLPMVREAMVAPRRNGGLSSQPSSAAGSTSPGSAS